MSNPVQGGSRTPVKGRTGSSWLKTLAPYLGVLALVGGAFQVGYSMGKDQSAELKEFYRTKIDELERQRRDTQGKLNQAREAQAILARDLGDCKRHSGAGGQSANSVSGNQAPGTARVQILVGETAEVFKSQLTITVRTIDPVPAAPGYKVVAVLGSPGKPNFVWGGSPGDKTNFAGFEILIRSVDAASAFFLVERIVPASPAQP
jgi:hypothetical protein